VETRFHAAVQRAVEHLPIWSAKRVLFVRTKDIDWIDAADDRVRLHVAQTTHLTRDSMANMEARLPPAFLRIHRSVIVNTTRIRDVQPWFKSDYVVILRDGTRFTSGRTYRDRLRALLGRGGKPDDG
jgi:two-component system LytT family response regulator